MRVFCGGNCRILLLVNFSNPTTSGFKTGNGVIPVVNFRDRETIATIKKETEEKLNEVLTKSKKHAIVANNLFHTVQVKISLNVFHLCH